jgi:protein O-GlcNAc transferase
MLKPLLAALLSVRWRPQSARELATAIPAAQAAGDHETAIRLCRRLLSRRGDDPQAWAWLAFSQAMRQDYAGSTASFRELARLAPDSRMAHANLANLALIDMRLAEAESHYRTALACPPQAGDPFPDAVLNTSLGFVLLRQGQAGQAIGHLRQALAEQPANQEAATHLLYALQHAPGESAQAIHAAALAYARIHEQPLLQARPAHGNLPDPQRRLRIGYVSGDFAQHAVANFIEPVLAHHDRLCCEIWCYSNRTQEDAQTVLLRGLADHWHDIAPLDDDAVARQIAMDGVDILVDLSGHTHGHRLGVFARKPAPLQVTWLGYPTTTGLQSIDYRITDAIADPPGEADACHSEKLLRLPRSQWCYRPHPQAPAVSPLPALASGGIMFGSFNRLAKLNDGLLALWGRLLADEPAFALTIATLMDEGNVARVHATLRAHGAREGQVRVLGDLDDTRFRNIRSGIDIALDSHPYNGTTTTCEALWAGLPVVTLAGGHGAARNSASLLHAIGLPHLVADNEEDYLRIARELAQDLPALAALRAGLRERMLGHGLCDGPRFTRELEAAYRGIWQDWCEPAHRRNGLVTTAGS